MLACHITVQAEDCLIMVFLLAHALLLNEPGFAPDFVYTTNLESKSVNATATNPELALTNPEGQTQINLYIVTKATDFILKAKK